MRYARRVLIAGLLVLACLVPAIALGQSKTILSGTVNYSDPVSLSSSARLYVRLFENSSVQIAEMQPILVGGQAPPYAFSLSADSSAIKANNTYDLEVIIAEGQSVRLKSQPRIGVLNGKPSTNLDVNVSLTSGTLPPGGSGMNRLLLAAALAALAGLVALMRIMWRRSAPGRIAY